MKLADTIKIPNTLGYYVGLHITKANASDEKNAFIDAKGKQLEGDYETRDIAPRTAITTFHKAGNQHQWYKTLIPEGVKNVLDLVKTNQDQDKVDRTLQEFSRIFRNQIHFLISFVDVLIQNTDTYTLDQFDPKDFALEFSDPVTIEYKETDGEKVYKLRYGDYQKSLMEVRRSNDENYSLSLESLMRTAKFKTLFRARLDNHDTGDITVHNKQSGEVVFPGERE